MSFNFYSSLPEETKHKLSFSEVEALISIFTDAGGNDGEIPAEAVGRVVDGLINRFGNERSTRQAFSQFTRGKVVFSEFVRVFLSCKGTGKKITQKGAGDSIHTFSEEEKAGYVEYINSSLRDDPSLQHLLPIDPNTLDIFSAISQGVLLCKLINRGFPDTIPESKITTRPINDFQKNENHDKCIEGALKIGCSVVNIGGQNLIQGTPHLVLGLVWQIIKKSLLALVAANMQAESENPIDVPPEQILFKWFNYHLKNAGCDRIVSNWSSDLRDSELYALLLSQLEPQRIGPEMVKQAMDEDDLLSRAEMVLGYAEQLGCRKFVTPKEIVNGNPRLNLAFVATLFNTYPHMGPTSEQMRLTELEKKLVATEDNLAKASEDKESVVMLLKKKSDELDAKHSEFEEVSLKLNDALADKEHLSKIKTQLETQLEEFSNENSSLHATIEKINSEKDALSNQLDEERHALSETRTTLEELRGELAATRSEAEETKRNLTERLDQATNKAAELEASLEQTRRELERTREEASRTQADLTARIEELERQNAELTAQLEQARKENEELTKKLNDETELRKNLEEELKETEEELEEVKAETDEEKTLLLQRIKDLEEELEQLKSLMEDSLDKAARERADALSRANQLRETALSEAERQRIAQMKKVQGLLSKVQREGMLYHLEKGALGTNKWKKRYFVLQDHFLSYYKDKKAFEVSKPMGIIYCQQCRVYELEEGKMKRAFCFQLDSGKQQHNMCASKLEEMKLWMKDIKEAKKKAIGVVVVSEDTQALSPRSPREEGSSSSAPTTAE